MPPADRVENLVDVGHSQLHLDHGVVGRGRRDDELLAQFSKRITQAAVGAAKKTQCNPSTASAGMGDITIGWHSAVKARYEGGHARSQRAAHVAAVKLRGGQR